MNPNLASLADDLERIAAIEGWQAYTTNPRDHTARTIFRETFEGVPRLSGDENRAKNTFSRVTHCLSAKGVRVRSLDLSVEGLNGDFDLAQRTIRVHSRLHPLMKLHVLFHEVGHVVGIIEELPLEAHEEIAVEAAAFLCCLDHGVISRLATILYLLERGCNRATLERRSRVIDRLALVIGEWCPSLEADGVANQARFVN